MAPLTALEFNHMLSSCQPWADRPRQFIASCEPFHSFYNYSLYVLTGENLENTSDSDFTPEAWWHRRAQRRPPLFWYICSFLFHSIDTKKSDPAWILSMWNYGCFRRDRPSRRGNSPTIKNQSKFPAIWEAKCPLSLQATARHLADFWAELIARTWQFSKLPWFLPLLSQISAITS